MKGWKHLAAATALASAAGGAWAAEAPLRIIPVDVEGGAATLYVTPQGHSLLIDTGWPAGIGGPRPAPGATPEPSPSSAERIVAAAKAAGLSRIDYLIISHYHVDHIGGVHDLMALFPIGTFIDHGPNREEPPANANPRQLAMATATLYPKYVAAIAGKPHRVMKAGETLRIDDLVITAVDSDGERPARPLPGATGKPGAGCAEATTDSRLGGEENPRSLGILATWGKARILSLADTTWNMENSLVCPRDLIGPVDLMLADNHGSDNSGSTTLLANVKPAVVVIANGPTKGGDAATLDRLMASPRIKAVWQLHFGTRAPEKNAPADQIANLADGPDARHPLQIAVAKDGTVTITNPRNGFSRAYPKLAR